VYIYSVLDSSPMNCHVWTVRGRGLSAWYVSRDVLYLCLWLSDSRKTV